PSAYHWEGDRLDRDLARAQHAAALGVQARLAVVPAEHLCRIAFRSNAAPPAALVLTLVHSTLRELDSRIALRQSGDGYAGPCDAPRSGHWHAELTDQAGTWMVRREIIGWIGSLEFSGRALAGGTK
ncbi:MAG: FixH family protein, partial [Steroidobacteraceae bacterium]